MNIENTPRAETALEAAASNCEVLIAQLATWAQIKTGNTERVTEDFMLVTVATMTVPAEA